MTQRLVELVDQFCQYQRKQRGKTDGGVTTYRWNLEQFLAFVHARTGRLARIQDLTQEMIQAWMDDMAAADLAINTLRCRQATLSRFCNWLVMRFLHTYVSTVLAPQGASLTSDTPLFWSSWGKRGIGKVLPNEPQNAKWV